MIKRIQLKHYRSAEDTSIDLQPDLSVLIGPNGSGKTTILRAFLLLRSLALEGPDAIFRRESSDEVADECRLKVSFVHAAKTATLNAVIGILTDEANSDVVLSSKQTWSGLTKSKKRPEIPLWVMRASSVRRYGIMLSHYAQVHGPLRIPEDSRDLLTTIAEEVADIKYYSASQFTDPARCPVSFEVEQDGNLRRGVRVRGHSKFLYDLHNCRETDAYEEFINIIGPEGVGLVDDINFQEIRTSSIEYSVRSGGRIGQRKREKLLVVPQFIIGRNSLSPNQLSEGTFKTIALLFYLVTQKSSILLVEEPEVCVHHGLLASIVELIRTYSKNRQIVLSTHSDFVLDQVEPRQVYKVSRTSAAGTKITSLRKSVTGREFAALKKYLAREGNLGEYWKHGGLD